MIPIPGLDQAHVAWLEIRNQGFVLYGFLLYSNQDEVLVNYMKNGLAELDEISGSECAIFVIESPSARWIERAKQNNHPWWHLMQNKLSLTIASFDPVFQSLMQYGQIQIDDKKVVPLAQLLNPNYDLFYDRDEIWKVARYFDIKPEKIPCLVLFKDFNDTELYYVDLTDLNSERQATLYFRKFFSSPAFDKIIREVKRYA